ncbi:SDR family NAD(P)-dependent oxidoreductase [Comamonas sp. NLF-1-9]|uniref:SDR family NAD(P)-dependent oxidoreductase n=1 Tax=Comamonas sp. NLF-1-9 TaxID=2853163 RepID=UPI001C48DEFF|nr:SDR family NAD(P)-dependent oxidoreductase [Comamonas sp. NLF-1-9]QXL83308.1 SDR family NAD(P)-dependent oxidoreductase [Comamonas sp. NLF-1-9]
MDKNTSTVCITGAAGHLGAALAAWFGQRGARLVLLDRNQEELQRRYGALSDALLVPVDLLAPQAVHEAVAAALARVQRIDVLCHLAGGFHMGEPVHETPAKVWDFMMDLNARSFIHIAEAVVPQMRSQGRGSIVAVGAAGGLKGGAAVGAYAASKSALMRLVESMSAELRDEGINVNAVLPSIIDTPPNRSAMPDADFSRWVAPEALAEVIGFLASDAARAVHGALLPVLGRV